MPDVTSAGAVTASARQLEGKVALITGSARGMGAAEARLFVDRGAHVVVCDLLDDLGETVAAELGDAAFYRHLDVSAAEDWRALVIQTLRPRSTQPSSVS